MSDVGFRSERGPVLIALMLSSGLVAIDSTILATAVPTIVHDLGGFAAFPWLFSVYLLAQAVSTPVYAKLADQVGRKPLMLVGIGLFLVGSVFAGFAWSMTALIVFRVVQGLGAGAIQPMGITIAGDIYSLAERARVQGYLASVWGIASVVGPTLGGVFSQFVSWRWIFFVNIPLCVLAAWMLWSRLHENVERRRHRIDYAGSGLLTGGLTLLILATLEGGQAWAWDSVPSIAAFAVGGVLLVLFVFAERRAAEPVLPLNLLGRRLVLMPSLVALATGVVVIGLTSYVPTFLEGTVGAPPVLAGLALAALTLGWPLAAAFTGKVYLRIGFRNTILIGVGIVLLGLAALGTLASHPDLPLVAAACFLTGIGMGFCAPSALVAAQTSVGWKERGVVTGTSLFARSVGSAVGVAVFGAIANAVFRAVPGGEQSAQGLETATLRIFIGAALFLAVAVVAGFAMPRGRAQDVGAGADADDADAVAGADVDAEARAAATAHSTTTGDTTARSAAPLGPGRTDASQPGTP